MPQMQQTLCAGSTHWHRDLSSSRCFPKLERFPWVLWFQSPSAEASRWHRAAFAFWNAAEESWARSTLSFWHLASVSVPDNSCRDQDPLNHLCEPESLSAAIGITLQKAGRGTHVTTDSVFACSLLQTLYQIRGRLLSEQGCTVVKGQCLLLSYLTW